MENNSDRMGFALIALSVVAFVLLTVNGPLKSTVNGFFDGFKEWQTQTVNDITETNKQDVTHTAYSWSSDGTDRFYVGDRNNLLTGTGHHTVTGTGAWTEGNLSNETTDNFLTLFKGLEGQTVTVSVDYEYSGFIAGSIRNRLGWEAQIITDTSTWLGPWFYPTNDSGSGRISSTFVVPKNITAVKQNMGYIQFSGSGTGTLSNLKIEKGSVATPWAPAPSDQPKYIGTYTDKNDLASQDSTKYTWKLNPDYHE